MEARRSSADGKPSSPISFFISSEASSPAGARRYFLASRSNSSRPRASERVRSSVLSHCLILARARVDFTILCQSWLGGLGGGLCVLGLAAAPRRARGATGL